MAQLHNRPQGTLPNDTISRQESRLQSALKIVQRRHWLLPLSIAIFTIFVIVVGFTVATRHSPSGGQYIKYVQGASPPIKAMSLVSLTYVDIPNENNTDNSAGLALVTSGGHYLYHIPLTNVFGGGLLGKVVYDGKVVYQDPNGPDPTNYQLKPEDFATDPGLMLSKNGEHYGYVLNSGVYVDGKLVVKTTDTYAQPHLLAISNNGQVYAYMAATGIYKNQTLINTAHDMNTTNIMFDDDLNHFVLSDSSGKYIYDGKTVVTNTNQPLFSGIGISSNGEHYFVFGVNGTAQEVISSSRKNPQYKACTTHEMGDPACMPYQPDSLTQPYIVSGHYTLSGNAVLVADGKTVYTSPKSTIYQDFKNQYDTVHNTTSFSSQLFDQRTGGGSDVLDSSIVFANITDNGDYYYLVGSPKPYFSIDGSYNYALPAMFTQKNPAFNTNFGPPYTSLSYSEFIAVTSQKDHYIAENSTALSQSKTLLIDGKQTQLSGNIYSIELDGNKLFVYRINN